MTPAASEVFFHGTVIIFDCTRSIKSGMKLKLQLELEEQYEKFRDIPKTTKQKTSIFSIFWRPVGTREFHRTMLWYLGYNVTNTAGAKVTFEIGEEEDFERFMIMNAGDEIEIMLVQIDTNEQPIDQVKKERIEKATRLKGGAMSKHAGRRCGESDFQAFLAARYGVDQDPAAAAEYVRKWCQVESRAMLDHVPEAKAAWTRLNGAFLDWTQRGS